MKKSYTKYCTNQKDSKARITQEVLINWAGEIWHGNKLPSEMISKSFKIAEITLALDGIEDKMCIGYNPLLEDEQVIVEQVEQSLNEQDDGMKGTKIDDNSNNSENEAIEEKAGIKFTEKSSS